MESRKGSGEPCTPRPALPAQGHQKDTESTEMPSLGGGADRPGSGELLRSRLSAPSDSEAETSCGAVKVSLGPVDPRSPGPAFNPFAQFNRIGSKDFDQSTISEWDWDWPQLLPTYQGMSQVTLRALLANR
ncbi:hypothetical protein MATL_G00065310 [Megalops atlanticus]|uniref:Uncharacterized protein n=1 Tax=Megalops atlanticus TaxID=7932 RepID=A0A9D3Q8R1_MEGAT|nr:hypothetical protein MATL_G00065310 [Megalops atlanticus]